LARRETAGVDQFDAGSRRSALAVVAAGNFVQLGSRLLVGAVVPLVLVYFGTSRSVVGVALTGMWAVYALLQFPSGVLADKYGERGLLVVALAATCLGVILVALSPSVVLFTLFVLALGAGAGLFFPPASALVSRLYENQGGALGVLTASGAVGGVLFPLVGGIVGVRFGWRVAVVVGAAATFAVLLATILAVPSAAPPEPGRSLDALIDLGRHRRLLSRPGVVYSLAVGSLVGFTLQATTSFLPTFLVEYRGLGPDVAGLAFGVVFGLSAVAQPVAGRLSDRCSRDVAIAASVTIALAGIGVLLSIRSTAGLVVGVGLLGTGIAWPGPVQARFFDQLGDEERGYGFGLLRTAYMLLGSSGSVVVGVLADAGGWVPGFGVLGVALGASLALLGANWWLSQGL
jgi:MFS family permease